MPQDRLHMKRPGRVICREKNLNAVNPILGIHISGQILAPKKIKILMFASNKITSSSVFLFSLKSVVTNFPLRLLYRMKGGP